MLNCLGSYESMADNPSSRRLSMSMNFLGMKKTIKNVKNVIKSTTARSSSSSNSKEVEHATKPNLSSVDPYTETVITPVTPTVAEDELKETPRPQIETKIRPKISPFPTSHLNHNSEKHPGHSSPGLVRAEWQRTLWDEAYDQIRKQDKSMVQWYEMIISGDLQQSASEAAPRRRSSEPLENLISQTDFLLRREQMNELLSRWFERSGGGETIRPNARGRDGNDALLPSYEAIFAEAAKKRRTETVIAWVPACYASKILRNPTFANREDCSRIIYVISRMEWYDLLSKLHSGDQGDDSHDSKLHDRIVDLYAAILSYLIKVVCSHFNKLDINLPMESINAKSDFEGIIEAESELPRFNKNWIMNPLNEKLEMTTWVEQAEPDTANGQRVKNSKLIEDLHVIDPRPRHMDTTDPKKKRAIDDIYNLLLKRSEYNDFRNWTESENRLLWISGAPGQGKTMLLNGVVQALPMEPSAKYLSFFFFDYRGPDSNNAAAALKTLIWHILTQQPALEIHLQEKCETTGRKHFDHPNDFIALSAVFYAMINDKEFQDTYVVIDSLDECTYDGARVGIGAFLDLIVMSISQSNRIRWLVSSNDKESIMSKFKGCNQQRLTLGSSEQGLHVVMESYITYMVSRLAADRSYDKELEEIIVKRFYQQEAYNYLWVDIVCEALRSEENWYVEDSMNELETLRDLQGLYGHLHHKLNTAPKQQDRDFYFDVLSTMAIVHQSLHINELRGLVSWPKRVNLEVILAKCSGFLQVRDKVVSFRHRSARDYVRTQILDLPKTSKAQAKLTILCLDSLARNLGKNFSLLEDGLRGLPESVSSAASSYESLHWAMHLTEISDVTMNTDILAQVHSFLNEHFLIWVDALGTAKRTPQATMQLQQADLVLQQMRKETTDEPNSLCDLIHDAHMFLQIHQSTNTSIDLPASNTLLFCPENSIIKKFWLTRAFRWLSDPPMMDQYWSPNFTNFRGHTDWIRDIAISSDGQLIASGSDDGTVRIWDTQTGTIQHKILVGTTIWVWSVAISKKFVAASTDDNTIMVWDLYTGHILKRLDSHTSVTGALCFSPTEDKLACSYDQKVLIWDVAGKSEAWQGKEIWEDVTASSLAFSPDGRFLIMVASTIRVWDIERGSMRGSFGDPIEQINCAVFSPYNAGEKKLIASGSDDGTVCIWNADDDPKLRRTESLEDIQNNIPEEGQLDEVKETGITKPMLVFGDEASKHRSSIYSVAFSPDGSQLASASNFTIDIWDCITGKRLRTLQAPDLNLRTIVFVPPDGAYIASSSYDKNVHLWNAVGRHKEAVPGTIAPKRKAVDELAICPHGKIIAGARSGGSIFLWDLESNKPIHREMKFDHSSDVRSLAFSPNGEKLLSASDDRTAQVCDVATGERLHIFNGHDDWVRCAAWSSDGNYVASASDDGSIRVWKIGGKEEPEPIFVKEDAHGGSYVKAVAFSPDMKYLVSGGNDTNVKVWDQSKHDAWETEAALLEGHTDNVLNVLVTPDSKHVLSASFDGTLRMWDLENTKETQPPINIDWVDTKMWWYPPPQRDQKTPSYVMSPQGIQPLSPSSSDIFESQTAGHWWFRYDDQSSGCWIKFKNQNIIFLPREYLPRSSLVVGDKAVIGTSSGNVHVFGASEGKSV
ncbi:hypothetical protein F4804DRAFT_313995 [Jackrogersella minutella]|nr:hypothetical protein F4804DRAFT_313995 [Jackrogersella minutella]